jgi:hypothetical protein
MAYIEHTKNFLDRLEHCGDDDLSEDEEDLSQELEEAFRALGRVSSRLDDVVISFSLRYVQWSADVLVQLGMATDPVVIDSLLDSLRYGSQQDRVHVLQALGKLADLNNAKVVKALMDLMPLPESYSNGSYDSGMFRAIWETLCKVIHNDDQVAMIQIFDMLLNSNQRAQAYQMLSRATSSSGLVRDLDRVVYAREGSDYSEEDTAASEPEFEDVYENDDFAGIEIRRGALDILRRRGLWRAPR